MKRTAFLLTVLFASLLLNAQNRVKFAYDQAGNRVKREIVITRAHSPQKSTSKDKSYYDNIGEHTVKISYNNGVIKVMALQMLSTDEGDIAVYSINGSKVFNSTFSSAETLVDISDKPQGVYILKVTINGVDSTWKVTKK